MQNGAAASGQDTENVSETSSAKQRRNERMRKINIEFESILQPKQVRFDWKTLERLMQLKELEAKQQLLKKERELARKLMKTALENDNLSQSDSPLDKSSFNWTPNKSNFSDWAS